MIGNRWDFFIQGTAYDRYYLKVFKIYGPLAKIWRKQLQPLASMKVVF